MIRTLAFIILALAAFAQVEAALVDDRAIRIQSAPAAEAKRKELVSFLWGAEGFPTKKLPLVTTNIAVPVRQLTNLARVDEFRIDLAPGLEGLAWHFIPARGNRELVVVHHGHACALDDEPGPDDKGYGLQRTIHALLREGYGVLGVFMPRMRPGDCSGGHDALFKIKTVGSPMKFFLEPVSVSLNQLRTNYTAFHMTGLSGGGWTTTVYAAIDPTIRVSVPIAGSIPLYLRTGGSVGDLEQFEDAFYGMAGYLELYLLGAQGRGRRQIQILLRKDDCCFGEAQHDAKSAGRTYAEAMREYESRVRAALPSAGGEFHLEIDETAPSHMISHHAIEKILLPALRR